MTAFDFRNRNKILEGNGRIITYDLIVIGGGITGAGIALDAASRGMKVLLLEKEGYASGTSSRSTKLIHGGLRYLKQFNIKIVRETGTERAIAHKIAPHLVLPKKMLLPLYKDGTYGKITTWFGLWIYDLLAGVKGADRRKMFSKKKVLDIAPELKSENLKGGGYYAEYRTDDARLTLTVLKTAITYGASAVSYFKVNGFQYSDDKIVTGVNGVCEISGKSYSLKAKQVVNASGPWADAVRAAENNDAETKIILSKGVHIVVNNEKLPLKQSVYFDVEDGRMLFAIPRLDKTYIGTTDTFYKGDKNNPSVTNKDVNYLLEATNNMFPNNRITKKDICATWSGLRPLVYKEGKDPGELSRNDEVFISESGLITITGGKLTGYRLMAKKVVDRVADNLNNNSNCSTAEINLIGKPELEINKWKSELKKTLEKSNLLQECDYLAENYGAECYKIINLLCKYKSLEAAECSYLIENEQLVNIKDFYTQYTGRLYFRTESILPSCEEVINVFTEYFNWSEKEQEEARKKVREMLDRNLNFT